MFVKIAGSFWLSVSVVHDRFVISPPMKGITMYTYNEEEVALFQAMEQDWTPEDLEEMYRDFQDSVA
jgi:hypothetical protein